MKKSSKLIFLPLTLILTNLLFAQKNPIRSVEIYLDNNEIIAAGHYMNVIDEDMAASLSSGLSSTLNYYIRLLSIDNKEYRSINKIVRLRYNVWEKVYDMSVAGQKHNFQSFGALENFINDSLLFHLGPPDGIPLKKKLRMILSFSPQGISDSQKDRLNKWLLSEGKVKESQPAYESGSGFSINLSNLLSAFFRKKEDYNIYLYKSSVFTLEKLRENENASR